MPGPLATFLAALLVQVPPPDAAERASRSLHDRFEAIRAQEAGALEAAAKRLEAAGSGTEARSVRERIVPEPPKNGPTRFEPLPEVVPAPAEGLANRPPLPDEVRAARDAAALAYFELAHEAAAPGTNQFSLADAALREMLHRQPDHREARR